MHGRCFRETMVIHFGRCVVCAKEVRKEIASPDCGHDLCNQCALMLIDSCSPSKSADPSASSPSECPCPHPNCSELIELDPLRIKRTVQGPRAARRTEEAALGLENDDVLYEVSSAVCVSCSTRTNARASLEKCRHEICNECFRSALLVSDGTRADAPVCPLLTCHSPITNKDLQDRKHISRLSQLCDHLLTSPTHTGNFNLEEDSFLMTASEETGRSSSREGMAETKESVKSSQMCLKVALIGARCHDTSAVSLEKGITLAELLMHLERSLNLDYFTLKFANLFIVSQEEQTSAQELHPETDFEKELEMLGIRIGDLIVVDLLGWMNREERKPLGISSLTEDRGESRERCLLCGIRWTCSLRGNKLVKLKYCGHQFCAICLRKSYQMSRGALLSKNCQLRNAGLSEDWRVACPKENCESEIDFDQLKELIGTTENDQLYNDFKDLEGEKEVLFECDSCDKGISSGKSWSSLENRCSKHELVCIKHCVAKELRKSAALGRIPHCPACDAPLEPEILDEFWSRLPVVMTLFTSSPAFCTLSSFVRHDNDWAGQVTITFLWEARLGDAVQRFLKILRMERQSAYWFAMYICRQTSEHSEPASKTIPEEKSRISNVFESRNRLLSWMASEDDQSRAASSTPVQQLTDPTGQFEYTPIKLEGNEEKSLSRMGLRSDDLLIFDLTGFVQNLCASPKLFVRPVTNTP